MRKQYYRIKSKRDWETVDFEDNEESLACCLDDNDMHAILTCIDAKCTLKKLKLAGYTHTRIDGRCGLQPLAGSSVLEKLIDLRTVDSMDCPPLQQRV